MTSTEVSEPAKPQAPQRKKQAIDAPRKTVFMMDPDELLLIGKDTKHKSLAEHSLYDEKVHLDVSENDVLDVITRGVLETAIIQKDGDRWNVVDGRQRVKRARLANIKLRASGREPVLVPCLIFQGTDADAVGVMISANEHRTEDTPLSKARKLAHYLSMGRSEDDAAVAFNVGRGTIKNWLAVLDCCADVQHAVETEKVSASFAVELSKLTRDEQKTKLTELVAAGATTAADAKRAVTRAKRDTAAGARSDERDDASLGGDGGDYDTPARPAKVNKSDIKHILAYSAARVEAGFEPGLNEDVLKAFRYIVGDLPATKIKGLSAILKALDA